MVLSDPSPFKRVVERDLCAELFDKTAVHELCPVLRAGLVIQVSQVDMGAQGLRIRADGRAFSDHGVAVYTKYERSVFCMIF